MTDARARARVLSFRSNSKKWHFWHFWKSAILLTPKWHPSETTISRFKAPELGVWGPNGGPKWPLFDQKWTPKTDPFLDPPHEGYPETHFGLPDEKKCHFWHFSRQPKSDKKWHFCDFSEKSQKITDFPGLSIRKSHIWGYPQNHYFWAHLTQIPDFSNGLSDGVDLRRVSDPTPLWDRTPPGPLFGSLFDPLLEPPFGSISPIFAP